MFRVNYNEMVCDSLCRWHVIVNGSLDISDCFAYVNFRLQTRSAYIRTDDVAKMQILPKWLKVRDCLDMMMKVISYKYPVRVEHNSCEYN